MNVSVILGHPSKGSFNHGIADTVVTTLQDNGHQVLYHDLYEERFDPALTASEIPKNTDLHPLFARIILLLTVINAQLWLRLWYFST